MELAALFDASADYSPESDWMAALPTGGAVYLLTDENDRPIQLATTADLKRALRHRLGTPTIGEAQSEAALLPEGESAAAGEEGLVAAPEAGAEIVADSSPSRSRRADLREITRRIWLRRAHSQFELTYAYYRLARELMPKTYRKQLGFGPAWFVHVDSAAHLPQFTSAKLLRSPPGVDLGPMATQADAGRLIEILQDAFDLCRYYNILEQAPHGQACAYFEMGKCPAPCDGSIPLSQYRDTIGDALAFARGERKGFFDRLESAMLDAAANQIYERAASIKKQIDRARTVEHASFGKLGPIDEFNWLIVQRGAGTTRLRPFFVRGGAIEPGDEVKNADLAVAAPMWIERMKQPPVAISPEERSEHIWLVSHFVFKPETPGFYLRVRELGDPEALVRAIRTRFASKAQKQSETS